MNETGWAVVGVLGTMVVGGLSFGGYKLYKHMTKDKNKQVNRQVVVNGAGVGAAANAAAAPPPPPAAAPAAAKVTTKEDVEVAWANFAKSAVSDGVGLVKGLLG